MRHIRWKVVKNNTNKSALIDSRSPFCLTYTPGENVFAKEDTLGVMVFKTKANAEIWMGCISMQKYKQVKLIKVIPIGKGKTPEKISSKIKTHSLRSFYNDLDKYGMGNTWSTNEPLSDSICYPGVHVLE